MSTTTTPDRTNPDHNWTGTPAVASGNDVADAVAHMKAWFAKEIAAVKTSAGPAVAALETRVAELEGKLKAALATPGPAPSKPATAAVTEKASDA